MTRKASLVEAISRSNSFRMRLETFSTIFSHLCPIFPVWRFSLRDKTGRFHLVMKTALLLSVVTIHACGSIFRIFCRRWCCESCHHDGEHNKRQKWCYDFAMTDDMKEYEWEANDAWYVLTSDGLWPYIYIYIAVLTHALTIYPSITLTIMFCPKHATKINC